MRLLDFSFSCLLSSFPLYDPVSPFLVSLLTIPCPVSPSSPCLPFPLPSLSFYEGQVQGSPITQRGLRKLYGLCPRGCHVALSSGRLQVRSSHWLPAQQPQTSAPAPGRIDSARFKPSLCLSGWLAPSQPPSLIDLLGRTNMYV